jgi:hypothetical protein
VLTQLKQRCKHDSRWLCPKTNKMVCTQHYKAINLREFQPWEELGKQTRPMFLVFMSLLGFPKPAQYLMKTALMDLRSAFSYYKYRVAKAIPLGGEG